MSAIKEDMSKYFVCSKCDCELEDDNLIFNKCFVCDEPLADNEDDLNLIRFQSDMMQLDDKGKIAYFERMFSE